MALVSNSRPKIPQSCQGLRNVWNNLHHHRHQNHHSNNIIIYKNDHHHHKNTNMDPNMVRLWMGNSPNLAFPRHRWRRYIQVFLAMESASSRSKIWSGLTMSDPFFIVFLVGKPMESHESLCKPYGKAWGNGRVWDMLGFLRNVVSLPHPQWFNLDPWSRCQSQGFPTRHAECTNSNRPQFKLPPMVPPKGDWNQMVEICWNTVTTSGCHWLLIGNFRIHGGYMMLLSKRYSRSVGVTHDIAIFGRAPVTFWFLWNIVCRCMQEYYPKRSSTYINIYSIYSINIQNRQLWATFIGWQLIATASNEATPI